MTGLSSVSGLVGVNSKCGVQSKESTKAMTLAFVLLDFSACGCQKKSVVYEMECIDMLQFKKVSRTRTTYSIGTHTSDYIFNTFWNGKPEQFFQERYWVLMAGCRLASRLASCVTSSFMHMTRQSGQQTISIKRLQFQTKACALRSFCPGISLRHLADTGDCPTASVCCFASTTKDRLYRIECWTEQKWNH